MWRRVLGLVGLLLILAVPALAAINLQVTITSPKNYVPVTVIVNGMNIKDLERKYDKLSAELLKTKISLAQFAEFLMLKNKVYMALLNQLVQAIKHNNTTQAMYIVEKIGKVDAMADAILLHFLQTISTKKSTSLGWFDIYGNHRDFNDSSYFINPNFDFRLTDCYSKLGKSIVRRGGTITVRGVLMDRKMICSRLTVKLLDPDTGTLTTIIGSGIGENLSSQTASITWKGNDFTFKLNVTGLRPGMKELLFEYGNYTVACKFRII